MDNNKTYMHAKNVCTCLHCENVRLKEENKSWNAFTKDQNREIERLSQEVNQWKRETARWKKQSGKKFHELAEMYVKYEAMQKVLDLCKKNVHTLNEHYQEDQEQISHLKAELDNYICRYECEWRLNEEAEEKIETLKCKLRGANRVQTEYLDRLEDHVLRVKQLETELSKSKNRNEILEKTLKRKEKEVKLVFCALEEISDYIASLQNNGSWLVKKLYSPVFKKVIKELDRLEKRL